MKTPLIFGIHCHQPAENFYHVVDWAIESSYAPFIATALKSKKFRFAAHYSGWLLEYIKTRRPDVFKNMKTLSDEGRIEFFTGGFYEPVLSAIPSDDRRAQVKMLSDYIKNNFGQSPAGLWLTERVWDPAIVPDMYECGVKHIIVDDYHLIAAGFPRESITGYFRTEQDGCPMNLFPIDMTMRYLTPFKPKEDVIQYIKSAGERNVKFVSCFDDGEKFGVWPNTYDWVYTKGWLKNFIDAIGKEKDIEFMLYGEAAEAFKPAGIAYLPITSYEEMGEWSLFSASAEHFETVKKFMAGSPYASYSQSFLKGSIWKNFLVKYPESNRLHKRCIDLSLRGRPYKTDRKFANALYQSECNDSLWHGVFGGLYLPNLRSSAWAALIEAETLYETLSGTAIPCVEQRDCDTDGYDEVYARTKNFNALFVSRDGGQLAAIEMKKECFNLLNVISRKKEAYHEKYMQNIGEAPKSEESSTSIHEQTYYISKETADKIAYDWYNKNSFIDHFSPDFDLSAFEKCAFTEFGDFVNQPFEPSVKGDKITFERKGGLYACGVKTPATMKKVYKATEKGIDFEITAASASDFKCKYVLELNLHFAETSKITLNGKPFEEKGSENGKKFVLHDPYLKKDITLDFGSVTQMNWHRLYTVSQSESGIDLTVQGVTFLFPFEFDNKISISGSLKIY